MSVAEIVEMPTEELRRQVKEAHLQANQCAIDALCNAIKCGELLTKAKASCKHGEFGAFVCGCGITPRMAQNYMKLFSEQSKIPYYKDRVGAISIRDALKLLHSPKKEKGTQNQQRIKYNLSPKCETRFAFESESTNNHAVDIKANQDQDHIDPQDDTKSDARVASKLVSKPAKRKTALTDDDKERIDKQYDANMSAEEIAEDNDLPIELVKEFIEVIDSPAPPPPWSISCDIMEVQSLLFEFIEKHQHRWSDDDETAFRTSLAEFAQSYKIKYLNLF